MLVLRESPDSPHSTHTSMARSPKPAGGPRLRRPVSLGADGPTSQQAPRLSLAGGGGVRHRGCCDPRRALDPRARPSGRSADSWSSPSSPWPERWLPVVPRSAGWPARSRHFIRHSSMRQLHVQVALLAATLTHGRSRLGVSNGTDGARSRCVGNRGIARSASGLTDPILALIVAGVGWAVLKGRGLRARSARSA